MLNRSAAAAPPLQDGSGGDVSLAERVEQVARSDAGLTFLDDALRPTRIPYRDLAARAVTAARGLRRAGVAPGDRFCLLSATSPALLAVLFGAWRLGAVPVVLPRPRKSPPAEQVEEIERRAASAGAAVLLTDAHSADPAAAPAGIRVLSIADVADGGGSGPVPPMPGPEDLGLLQFTSGTTSASHAVPVTQGQMLGNLERLASSLGVGPGDRYVTWLPLYHDMGVLTLAGFAAVGLDLAVMATETFTRSPSAWMRTIHDLRGTVTFAPNFAYGLAARMLPRSSQPLDLSCLRVAVNGAEAIDADGLEDTLGVMTRYGMRAEAMCPGYGLAEATLAVTVDSPGTAPRSVRAESAPGADPVPERRLMCCGTPLADTELSVRDEAGAALAPGRVGEILVRGPGVMRGYWGEPDPSGDRSGVAGGWLHTGDLGFVDEGELVVCGRIKDLVIVGGRNLYPEDYEVVAERVPGIRSGNVAAFSLPDAERMVVVAEARGDSAALGSVAEDLFARLRGALDHAPHEVVLIRPGTLPKTSSGKRRRGASREQYLEGTLEVTSRAG